VVAEEEAEVAEVAVEAVEAAARMATVGKGAPAATGRRCGMIERMPGSGRAVASRAALLPDVFLSPVP